MTKETNEKTPSSAIPAKKPYQKPAFRHERVFETMALSCGKANVAIQNCNSTRKTS